MTHHDTTGDRQLSAWLVAPGICWMQTRSPLIARKLSQRADSRLVARGVAGGFLRTFEVKHGLTWARQLVARYTKNDKPTNEAFLSPPSRPARRRRPPGSQGPVPPKGSAASASKASPSTTAAPSGKRRP